MQYFRALVFVIFLCDDRFAVSAIFFINFAIECLPSGCFLYHVFKLTYWVSDLRIIGWRKKLSAGLQKSLGLLSANFMYARTGQRVGSVPFSNIFDGVSLAAAPSPILIFVCRSLCSRYFLPSDVSFNKTSPQHRWECSVTALIPASVTRYHQRVCCRLTGSFNPNAPLSHIFAISSGDKLCDLCGLLPLPCLFRSLCLAVSIERAWLNSLSLRREWG